MRQRLPKLLALVAIILPVGLYVWAQNFTPPTTEVVRKLVNSHPSIGPIDFEKTILEDFSELRPRVTNLAIADLNQDGKNDLLVCDAVRNTVWWAQRKTNGSWTREPLVPENSIPAPCHVELTDIDSDGDMDVVVAVLQSVWPTDVRLGQVVALINDGECNFERLLIAEDLRRVADVQPADLDGDGDIDLAIAEFGYLHGRVLWLENLGGMQFADHTLLSKSGSIHVPVADYDLDGDLDIAAVVSQDHEEVWVFENTGEGAQRFLPQVVWTTSNYDLGLAGMVKCDLDRDGDQDLLLSSGDNLELSSPCPQPHHGCIWLENVGALGFQPKQVGKFPGTYATAAADLDDDGDTDIVLASMFNDWKDSESQSLAWLENDGHQAFRIHAIASTPTHLCTVTCGDLTGDGRTEILAGSLHIFPPYSRTPTGLPMWQVGNRKVSSK